MGGRQCSGGTHSGIGDVVGEETFAKGTAARAATRWREDVTLASANQTNRNDNQQMQGQQRVAVVRKTWECSSKGRKVHARAR